MFSSLILARAKAQLPPLVLVGLLLVVLVAVGMVGPGPGLLVWLAMALAGLLVPAPARVAQETLPEAAPRGPDAEAVIGAVASPITVLDRDGIVIGLNKAATELYPALRAGEPISFGLRNPEVLDAVRGVAADAGRRKVEYAERIPVERQIEAAISAVPAAAPENGAEYLVVVLYDLTQRMRLERMRADFVANASHELRTPLASLLGFVETLQGPARNDAVARDKFLGIMRAQAARMSRLIDDLLSLSRIELNAHVRPDHPLDLVPIVGHVADTLAPLAEERGVAVNVVYRAEKLEVLGERDELIRVFENLVENAIKYGADGGRVDITLAAQPRPSGNTEEAVVTVRDYGAGIPSEHVPRLTERFYRVDAAQSREKGGTGLGLAIVKHIVARHRGRLAIESLFGEGSAFTVTLDRLNS